MATSYRFKAKVLNPVTSISPQEHEELKRLGKTRAIDWATDAGVHGLRIAKLREELKSHYYRHQRRRCCYCSVELQSHKMTYDAEHILDKADYPEYMFEPTNISAVCKLCNGYKSNKEVSTDGLRFNVLSAEKDDYAIVHPHLDHWYDHLDFDVIGRIVPKENSSKGHATISICRISVLNATRLADEFDIEKTIAAEAALRAFHEEPDVTRKREALNVLEEIAANAEYPGASTVMEALKENLREYEARSQLATGIPQLGLLAPPEVWQQRKLYRTRKKRTLPTALPPPIDAGSTK